MCFDYRSFELIKSFQNVFFLSYLSLHFLSYKGKKNLQGQEFWWIYFYFTLGIWKKLKFLNWPMWSNISILSHFCFVTLAQLISCSYLNSCLLFRQLNFTTNILDLGYTFIAPFWNEANGVHTQSWPPSSTYNIDNWCSFWSHMPMFNATEWFLNTCDRKESKHSLTVNVTVWPITYLPIQSFSLVFPWVPRIFFT